MLQRAELRRSLRRATHELTPGALVSRGKYRATVAVEDAADTVRQALRDYRVPITLAAFAGLVYAFRAPLGRVMPKIAERLNELADDALAIFRPGDDNTAEAEQMEDDHEAAE